ncbi:nitronate monooxygenase [Sandaracinobacter sp. RS1-74]|uniref:NAD(P)H-dependent flavin oxidoreductase n=1 Tax=Sandaracinobacteroides sayramensis TaxID=2913411 RepID=UPI001EDB4093|nr:nitronate monooxygenase [Sandaracinobacteroides sayramensis]MCG2841951.1 nitronate monooxygenase [Sandaracinobacteroides sayramensis]
MLHDRLSLSVPLIQAPMAGVSTPAMAAAVSDAGGLGSIALGAAGADSARAMIAEVRARTRRPFSVNLFAHAPATPDPARETAWIEWLAPLFEAFGAEPPRALHAVYKSFVEDADMLAMLLEEKPPVVSFHFGLPPAPVLAALKQAGLLLLASVTSPAEAEAAEAAGIDLLVAQGIEAGGHRGAFDADAPDDGLGTMALTRLLARRGRLPVVAAGGIMDGAGIAAALSLGAVAAQLGTAFILCPESAAAEAYRRALAGPGAAHTRLTALVSGRLARSLPNRFTALEESAGGRQPPDYPPDYPIAYDAGKALHKAASARGEYGFGAQWAGQGAPLARALPAAELVALLHAELLAARG